MSQWTRTWTTAVVAVSALSVIPGAIVLFQSAGEAHADVCASVGRRVSVSGCANLADVVAPYAPPPAYYAPMPDDFPPPPPPPPPVSGCVSVNGRWVSAGGCN